EKKPDEIAERKLANGKQHGHQCKRKDEQDRRTDAGTLEGDDDWRGVEIGDIDQRYAAKEDVENEKQRESEAIEPIRDESLYGFSARACFNRKFEDRGGRDPPQKKQQAPAIGHHASRQR